jgi:hypothetical protein
MRWKGSVTRKVKITYRNLLVKVEGRDNLVDAGVDRRIILKSIVDKKGVNQMKLPQYKVQWQTIVNTWLNLGVP